MINKIKLCIVKPQARKILAKTQVHTDGSAAQTLFNANISA